MKRSLNTWLAAALLSTALPALAASGQDSRLIQQGRDLALASDCMACHTDSAHRGAPYAGGYGIASPMGTIYATNITPAKTWGIGNYSEAQFAKALREGIRRDGSPLYPAMPYTAYTKLSDSDIHALYTYFMQGVAPVDEKPTQVTALPFPFNLRFSMHLWNLLFLDDSRFVPSPNHSAQWNEGAWLVEGPAHCGTCHTPRNIMMAEDKNAPLAGAQLGQWYAPNITADVNSGIGGWSEAQLVEYLKTGRTVGKSQAAGPMAEAVEHSFQHLTDSQLQAIAVYLKSTRPISTPGETAPIDTQGGTYNLETQLRGKNPPGELNSVTSGEALYSGYCASCHQPDGQGSENQAYPALVHNTVTGMSNPSNLIAAILNGVDRQSDGQHVFMPAFGQGSYVGQLSDEDVAKIATFVYHKFGNASVSVTPEQVAEIRRGGPQPLLAQLQPYMVPAMVAGIVALIILAGGIISWRRRKTRNAA